MNTPGSGLLVYVGNFKFFSYYSTYTSEHLFFTFTEFPPSSSYSTLIEGWIQFFLHTEQSDYTGELINAPGAAFNQWLMGVDE